jgi:probable phosphomutase (TIGR03848 family)
MVLILLIRHGQNKWVKKGRLAGWTAGVHLNETGLEQVERLGQRLAHLPLKAIYSSPLERCLETAAAVAGVHELDVVEMTAFGEVRYGQWEGKKVKKLAKKRQWHAVQHYPSRFRFPEGESFLEVQRRVIGALEELGRRHDKEIIAVVSHADVIKLALSHFLGMHVDLFQRIALFPASVSVLALSPDGPVRVLRVNDDGPMTLPAEFSEQAAATGSDTSQRDESHVDDGQKAVKETATEKA